MKVNFEGKFAKVRKPASAFRQCPYCESHDLFKFEGQAFCAQCGWNSIPAYCEAIELSRERSAHHSTGPLPIIRTKSTVKEINEPSLDELFIA